VSYTVLDLAALRRMSEVQVVFHLTSAPRADLALLCQHLGIKTSPKDAAIDLVVAILAKTHPRQAQAAQAGEASAQLGMF
jgi:hypothetical protein